MRDLRPLRAAACAAVLAALAAAAAPSALAGPSGPAPRKQKIRLVRPVRAPDDDAAGNATVRHTRGSDKVTVKLNHLEPGTSYTVVDPGTGVELGTVVANARGRARLRARAEAPAAAKSDAARVEGVAVFVTGEEPIVLVGGTDDAGRGTGPEDALFGDAFYGTLRGAGLSVSMFTDGADADSFWAGLDVQTEDGHEYLEYYADTIGDDALPLGVESVTDLAGRAFDVRDNDGAEVLAGDLPTLRALDKFLNGDIGIALPEVGEESDVTYEAPFTLRIANDVGTLVEVGRFEQLEFGLPGDLRAGIDVFGSWDGASGSLGLYADDLGACVSLGLYVPGDDGAAFYTYDASTSNGEGELPLGVASIDDLSGRAYELRDASGAAFVTGTVPALESVENSWDCDTDGEAISPGAAPYTFWIADDEGTLTQVGELSEMRDGGPGFPDIRFASLTYGGFDGDFASIDLLAGDGLDLFDVTIWKDGGRNGDGRLYVWSAGPGAGGDALPFDAASVTEFVGRRIEIRDADGNAVISDTLPELADAYVDPLGNTGSDETFRAGKAPFTVHLEDAGGTLRQVGRLEEYDIYANLPELGAIR